MDFKTFNHTVQLEGDQYTTFFPNGYGVSIVRNKFSYGGNKGLWEVAPLKGKSFEDSEILHDEVTGHFTEEEVNEFCSEISNR